MRDLLVENTPGFTGPRAQSVWNAQALGADEARCQVAL